MSLEKEYMQVNTSFHPSTKQAKQYIHDVETSANGKGRRTGHKNSTMSSSQVPTPFHSFTNQVNKCTKEVETIKDCHQSIKIPWSLRKRTHKPNTLVLLIKLCNIPKQLKKGEKDGNPPNLATTFFETCKEDNTLVELEAIEKHVCLAQIDEILKVEPTLPSIEIVEKCCGPQTRSHVFCFGGGVKAKDMKGGTSSRTELLSQLRSTQEENKSLNEKNKSLNDRLSTLKDEMKEKIKMQEFFASQQSHNLHMTSPSPSALGEPFHWNKGKAKDALGKSPSALGEPKCPKEELGRARVEEEEEEVKASVWLFQGGSSSNFLENLIKGLEMFSSDHRIERCDVVKSGRSLPLCGDIMFLDGKVVECP
ncbi:hypothetical protein KY290_012919 [Solanum tuberosum]|uniref:Uncharacterized protein n=1 Tax=Solanum tuberosum TaxID=4113 RepID=A0ABQ7VKJ2_SOLTU|nr:hypothetical protein KY285_012688 [Solanum tuberosum]KAH0768938.1 hypothetical protein KY290_012919 [Solanum tuberosum]